MATLDPFEPPPSPPDQDLADTLTKAKIYLGAGNDIFTVSNSGATVYGNTGLDAVTVTSGVHHVTLDQNIERINFAGASGNYAFKQTGNKINVYDATGSTLLASAPVQGDADGTVLAFGNGMASALLTAGVMSLGGATVSSGAATVLTPATIPTITSTVTLTQAKIYLGAGNDVFTVSNNGATVYGNTGLDAVTMASGVHHVTLDQNIERINFAGASGDYAFKQTGNKINVYDATGTTLLASAPVQGDADGTLLSFGNGVASATLAGGVMSLGISTVSPGAATTLAVFAATALMAGSTAPVTTGILTIDGIPLQVDGISGQPNINFGNDANGDPISLALVGLVDPALINVMVV